ncbi:hypothetical protein MKX03_032372 [Papaver bracteatum]|nr:hypothetical protein MKX03_032372 [Papaver bracteatum]
MVVYKSALSWCHSIWISVTHGKLNAYLLSLIMKCWQEGYLGFIYQRCYIGHRPSPAGYPSKPNLIKSYNHRLS